MFSRGLHGFDDQLRSRIAESSKNSSGVQPARAQLPEDVVPIEISRLELACGSMTPIRDAHRAANPKAALREVQTVAHCPAYTVVRNPLHKVGINPALKNKVPSNRPTSLSAKAVQT